MRRNHRWMTRALATMAIAIALPAAAQARTLGLEVWTDRGDDAVYQAGDAMQVKVRSSDDSYLLVYEIDATGQVSVLYPWRRGSNLVEGKRTYRLPPENSGYELAVEKATGQGYIVAIASRRPFRDLPWYLRPFDPQGESMGYEDRHDEEEGFDESGKVVGDPMVAMERIRRRVLDHPEATDDFATSYASYYVGHEVRYPRYLCADCHRPGRWEWWDGFDPYYTRCSVFDFRVNWNWCWGPCLWSSHQPYYYYVVRSDCPPRYDNWYQDHSRWSSWDGYRQFNQLWGGNLTRHKTPPPVGYQSPVSPTGKPAYNPGGSTPPGYLPPSGNNNRNRGGFREPIGIGRNRPADPTPGVRPGGAGRVPVSEPRVTPSEPRTPPASRPPEARPPREQPRQDPPRQDPPRQQPRQDPPRQDPPRQQEQPQHHDSPPADKPQRQEPQRQEPQRQEPQRDRGTRDR